MESSVVPKDKRSTRPSDEEISGRLIHRLNVNVLGSVTPSKFLVPHSFICIDSEVDVSKGGVNMDATSLPPPIEQAENCAADVELPLGLLGPS